ncbi:Rho guanine nucleotide exchange factor [Marasmius crinis-equi]|uniref:Rho guanine nucleotide exchange factor n=1 Tax=Marasmius crinis-equi TaxID=585013 RepID=A0ABR3FJ30_9AGAR
MACGGLQRLTEQLRCVVEDQTKLREVLEQKGAVAQVWLDRMQQVVDCPNTSPELRSSIFAIMLRLSRNSGLHPKCLSIQNVRRLGDYPIAAGGFGDVWKGAIGESSQPVCLKIVKLYLGSDVEKLSKEYLREAIVWRQMKHANLLPFLGIYRLEQTQQLCLISPWMEKGNLIQYLKTTRRENVDHYALARRGPLILLLVHDVASGLSHLHCTKIVHGDLKGVNILMTPDERACIGDFGLSRVADSHRLRLSTSTSRGPAGTARWLAPELLTGGDGTTKESDIYALGCVCYEVRRSTLARYEVTNSGSEQIFTGLQPFSEISQDAAVVLQVMLGARPKRPLDTPELSDSMWGVMKSCWVEDPYARPKADDVLAHVEKDNRIPAVASPEWAEPLFKQIWSNVELQPSPGELQQESSQSLLDSNTPVYDGSSLIGIYNGIQSPLQQVPPINLVYPDQGPLTPTSDCSDSPVTPAVNGRSPPTLLHTEVTTSRSPSPRTPKALPTPPDGSPYNTSSPSTPPAQEVPSHSQRKRHLEISYSALTGGETSPSSFGLGRTASTFDDHSPRGSPLSPNGNGNGVRRRLPPTPTSLINTPIRSPVEADANSKALPDVGGTTSQPQARENPANIERMDLQHDQPNPALNISVELHSIPSNVRERIRRLCEAGHRHAEFMRTALSLGTPYSEATGVTDEAFDDLLSQGLRLREEIAFEQASKNRGHAMIEKICLVEADKQLEDALRRYEEFARDAVRRRAILNQKHKSRFKEETMDRLSQECHIARENAGLLTRALIHAVPEIPEDLVVRKLQLKCSSSLEFITGQVPWAVLQAELACHCKGYEGVPDSDEGETVEENLLNDLLFAEEVLKGALQQYRESEGV